MIFSSAKSREASCTIFGNKNPLNTTPKARVANYQITPMMSAIASKAAPPPQSNELFEERMKRANLRILIDLPPTTAYLRGVIQGVAAYCRTRTGVEYCLPLSSEPLLVPPDDADGVVTTVTTPEDACRRAASGRPIVNVSSIRHPVPTPSVLTDNLEIGRMGADHLLAQGYRAFACHMESRVCYSVERFEGFRSALAEHGRTVVVFDSSPENGAPEDARALREETERWLCGLPKPVGLLTHNDDRAFALLRLCEAAGLRVPEEVGILGVDNDAFLDESLPVTLSSVDNAPSAVGRYAAATLVRLLEGLPVPSVSRVQPLRTVQRQSTQPVLTDDPLLFRAIQSIRRHACEGLDVEDLLREIPISRRALERSFRRRLGRSPAAEILRVRIDRAKVLLVESDLSIGTIAQQIGYAQSRNFATAFRREAAMEPREYRQAYWAPPKE